MSTSTTDNASPSGSSGYYYVKGARVPLEREPGVYAVRLRGSLREDSPVLSTSARRMLREESVPVGFIANYGLRVLRTRTGTGAGGNGRAGAVRGAPDALERVRELDREEGVDLAATAFRRVPGSEELMFSTRRFVVQFEPDISRDRIDALNLRHDVTIVEATGYMPNGFVLQAPSGDGETGPVAMANTYYETGLTLSATPDFVRQIHLKQAVTSPPTERTERLSVSTGEPTLSGTDVGSSSGTASSARGGQYLAQQWHLDLAEVVRAWDVTTGSPSIVVAVLDDGVDVDHQEFAGKVVGQSDFASRVSDARPKGPDNNHGTACAGVAVATGVKAHGSAPGCSLLAVRTPEYLGVADEADMFRWVCDQGADVVSCSWGPADGTGNTDPLPDNVRAAIRYCVTSGRSGRGIPIVWAAGNGDESVSLDGYASNPEVLAIGATTSKDTRAWYSDYGPEIWVCAPSSGSSAAGERRVFTVDRTGADGYNAGSTTDGDADGDYTNDFGGTSSATPLTAGVIALMLSVNDALTHQQVRDLLRSTAVRVGDAASYDANGHSPLYGFGRIDARAAVDAALAAASGGGGSPSPAPVGTPAVSAPTQVRRTAAAPTFQVSPAGNPLYAVEVASRWQLFDGAHDDERDDASFYGSWQDQALLSSPTFTLPDAVWHRLRACDRLYYRVHTAQDSSWTGWATSVPDDAAADAPWIEIVAAAVEEERSSGAPLITGPAQVDRDGPAPTFRIDPAGNPLYAVEVASRWQLFDGGHDAERDDASFYGSWQDQPLLTELTFRLPDTAWQWLRHNDVLYYRVHTAQDQSWTGWATSTPDLAAAAAPWTTITSSAPGGGTGGSGGSGSMGARTVSYPAATFVEALAHDDGIDYTDPVAGGLVPLIEVRDRLDDRLSAHFTVRELAARTLGDRSQRVAYARISPLLVQGLQVMRESLGAPISINSGYRYPGLNDDVDGASGSQHMAGRAADLRTSAVEPLELARIALEVMGRDIGLGLGQHSLHVDVRGEPASWVYTGAALSEADFDAWVRRTAADLGRGQLPRQDSLERTRPGVVGPLSAAAGQAAPTFRVLPQAFPFYGVEVAADWRLFALDPAAVRVDASAMFASWWEAGLTPSGSAGATTYTMPEPAWARLSGAARLYYRVVCATRADGSDGLVPSTPADRAEEAPSFTLTPTRSQRSGAEDAVLVATARERRAEEAHWRSAPGS